jgi:signal transduction histidine kinase
MTAIDTFFRDLFAANEVILLATYGQAFFVLCLSVALQWRSESRLELARSIPLLAAFGFVEAVVIWADLVIPRQEALLAPSDVSLLRLGQLLLMLIGFAFLLHFGLRLNWASVHTIQLPWLLAGFGALILFALATTNVDLVYLRFRFEQIARPIFVLVGAFAAALGMRNTAMQVEAMGLPHHIVTWLRVAGVSLGAYSLFGGLFIPLNQEMLRTVDFAFMGIPIAVPRLISIAVLAWAMIRALTIFRLELQRSMEEMGRYRALASDRQRIGRDLHDGTIQAIYGAGLLLENATALIQDNPQMAEDLNRNAMKLLNQTITDVRQYIFELSDGEGQLAEALGKLVDDTRQHTRVEIEYRLEGALPRYPSDVQNHLVQMAREALTNAIRHADATHITLTLTGEAELVVLTVKDDGKGLPPAGAFRSGGRGIPNLQARAALLNGTLRVANRPGGGTVVEIIVPHYQVKNEEKEVRKNGSGNKPHH